MKQVPLLETPCGSCHLLVINANLESPKRYSCPRNKHIPEFVNPNWAQRCTQRETGYPITKQIREDNIKKNPVFYTNRFKIRITPSHRTVNVEAKNGWKLALDASQSSEKKFVITSLEDNGKSKR